jgi:hypothetical protein
VRTRSIAGGVFARGQRRVRGQGPALLEVADRAANDAEARTTVMASGQTQVRAD